MQDWYVFFYSERPDLMAELHALAAELGRHLEEPELRRKYAWTKSILGFKTAKRAQIMLPKPKASMLRKWDKALYLMAQPALVKSPDA
jgi:hypothetical protein